MSQPSPILSILEEIEPLLRTRRFGRSVRGYHVTDSTNSAGLAWAEEGAPEGSLILAEHQTAGRGRFGRPWQAEAGRNLTFSLVLRPRLAADQLGLVTIAAGIAVADVLSRWAEPLQAAIKWPNDILLEGKKCCGMLLESTPGAGGRAVVLGLGLNVNQDGFPEELADRATSLLLATGRPAPRAPLLVDLLGALEIRYDALVGGDTEVIRTAYLDRLAGLGDPVRLRLSESDTAIEGRLSGIAETGALLLDTETGCRHFHAGEVSFDLSPAQE